MKVGETGRVGTLSQGRQDTKRMWSRFRKGEDCWEGSTNVGSVRLALIDARDTTMHLFGSRGLLLGMSQEVPLGTFFGIPAKWATIVLHFGNGAFSGIGSMHFYSLFNLFKLSNLCSQVLTSIFSFDISRPKSTLLCFSLFGSNSKIICPCVSSEPIDFSVLSYSP